MNLQEVKQGDKVFLSSSGWGRMLQVRIVEKVTKLHIIVDGDKYRRSSGHRAGDNWSGFYLAAYDEKEWLEYLDERRTERIRNRVREFDWKNCDRELLLKVNALLPEDKADAQATSNS